jgi:predicted nucleotidyltransferase
MDSPKVLKILREHEEELKRAGVLHLSVFGSVARGDSTPESDIDLMAEFDKSKGLNLVSIGRIQSDLTDWLGAQVDLSTSEWMKQRVRIAAEREAVLAF